MSKQYKSTLFIYFNIFSSFFFAPGAKIHGINQLDAAKNYISCENPSIRTKNVTEFQQNYLPYIHLLLSQLSDKLKIKSLRDLASC